MGKHRKALEFREILQLLGAKKVYLDVLMQKAFSLGVIASESSHLEEAAKRLVEGMASEGAMKMCLTEANALSKLLSDDPRVVMKVVGSQRRTATEAKEVPQEGGNEATGVDKVG